MKQFPVNLSQTDALIWAAAQAYVDFRPTHNAIQVSAHAGKMFKTIADRATFRVAVSDLYAQRKLEAS